MSADVRSLDVLPDLASSLARFSGEAGDAIAQASASVARAVNRLDASVRQREFELEQLSQEYDSLDHDQDDSWLRDRIYEAQADIRRSQEARDHIATCEEAFRRRAERVDDLLTKVIPAALAVLERKHQQLVQYVALSPPGLRPAAATGGGPSSHGAFGSRAWLTATASAPSGPHEVLPPGFSWIAVDAVEPVALSPDEFRKVSAEEITRGFRELTECVLPALSACGQEANSDFFGARDRRAGKSYGDGSQRAYDAFFGTDPIVVNRRHGDALWKITNGRHRLQVARQMGMTYVPARLREVS